MPSRRQKKNVEKRLKEQFIDQRGRPGGWGVGGSILLYTGPTCSGKSDELKIAAERAIDANINYRAFIYEGTETHIPMEHDRIPRNDEISDSYEILEEISQDKDISMVIVDDVEKFDEAIVWVCNFMADHGIEVRAAGWELDYLGEVNDTTAKLMCAADFLVKQTGVCDLCEGYNFPRATRTQRLQNGRPVVKREAYNEKGADFQARCRKHFIPGKKVSYGMSPDDKKFGFLHVITGCMYSGKTERLLTMARKFDVANRRYSFFLPDPNIKNNGKRDTKADKVVSHTGNKQDAMIVSHSDQIYEECSSGSCCESEIVFIDEAQFFDDSFVEVCNKLANKGFGVVVGGLDNNFRGEPYSHMKDLLATSDRVEKLHAVCSKCNSLFATRSQRIIDGEPAHYDEEVHQPGGKEKYSARCRHDHQVPGNPYKMQ